LHLYGTLLTQIQLEREGSVVNRSVLKSNIDMLSALTYPQTAVDFTARHSVYKMDFEPALLATSEEFYKAEAQRLLDGHDAARYLQYVERRFTEEQARVAVYLSSSTDAELSRILERCLLSAHLNVVVDMPGSGIVAMLEEDRRDDLARMYRLFWRVTDGPLVTKLGLKAYIASKGNEINGQISPTSKVREEEAESSVAGPSASTPQAQIALKWVEDVLAFKRKFDKVWQLSLQSDKGCETSINEAFETFVNINPRSPEFISLFIDENLKKGLKGKTEEEVEEVLQRTITVFRFLHEKDVFERYYKNHLAKRLLQGRSVSDDAERGMMAKLKIECGHGYVQKLQGMLNDVKVSDDTMHAFNESLQHNNREMPFDLSANVLTSTYWPISAQAPPCTMPASMIEAKQVFERFYQARHSGRLLTWHPNYGSADVRVQFRTRKHELNVSTYALVVLLLFEERTDGQALTYVEIQQSTSILDADLMRTLQSLACAKYKILLKEPKGRDVGKTDKFIFNDGFQCNLARIKIAQIAARVETATERKETTEKVEEERKNQVEACLVRVMKDRKTMSHNELVNEVIRQLASRFQPSPALVKRRIESLIDREYLERSESSMNVYHYQA
jgi:cullin 3